MTSARTVFVDTGAWVALRYGRDQYHGRARTILKRPAYRPSRARHHRVVLAETVTLLKARGAVDHAIALGPPSKMAASASSSSRP